MSFRSAVAFLSDRVQHAEIAVFGEGGCLSTHILRFDLGLAFSQAILNIFILSTFVGPKALNQVVERLFEPGWHGQSCN
jgi:hypothetical protein